MLASEEKLRNCESAEKASLQTEKQKDGAGAQRPTKRTCTSKGKGETERERNLHNHLLGPIMLSFIFCTGLS